MSGIAQSASGLLAGAEAGAVLSAGGEELCCDGLHATNMNATETRTNASVFITDLLCQCTCIAPGRTMNPSGGSTLRSVSRERPYATLLSRAPVTCMAGDLFSNLFLFGEQTLPPKNVRGMAGTSFVN